MTRKNLLRRSDETLSCERCVSMVDVRWWMVDVNEYNSQSSPVGQMWERLFSFFLSSLARPSPEQTPNSPRAGPSVQPPTPTGDALSLHCSLLHHNSIRSTRSDGPVNDAPNACYTGHPNAMDIASSSPVHPVHSLVSATSFSLPIPHLALGVFLSSPSSFRMLFAFHAPTVADSGPFGKQSYVRNFRRPISGKYFLSILH